VAAPALCAPQDVAPLPAQSPLTACGNGFTAYPEAFAAQSWAVGALVDIMPQAADVARLAAPALAAGKAVTAAEAQPLYLRNKIAYTAAERAVINAAKAAA
jgi:tRNA threonylcarbamoyladenosine biosynthesis protein TsaB